MLKSFSQRKEQLYVPFLIIFLSCLTAYIVLFASSKVIVAFFLMPVLLIFYINTPPFAKIVFPMVMITFPVTLQALGKDAFSTGTLVIFISLAWGLSKYKFNASVASDKGFFILLFLLAIIGLIGMATKTPAGYLGPAIRHYVDLVSSIAFFFLLVHSQNILGIADSKNEFIEKLITTLLIITVAHVFLSLLLINYPGLEKYMTIFMDRTQENLGKKVGGFYQRATGIFVRSENFGELLLLLFPFSLYKLYTSKKKIYFFITALFLFGTIISGTRSAFFLIVVQLLLFIFIFSPQKYNKKRIIITLAFISIGLLMLPVVSKYSPMLSDRLKVTFDAIRVNEDLFDIANRSMVWVPAYKLTINTLSLFGHGPTQATVLGYPVYNFHSLYLSILFQFGILGSIVFTIFFVTLAKRLWQSFKRTRKNESYYLLVVACLLSLIGFLINEIKYEFNRGDSYQQFVWCVFAIYYLTGTSLKNNIRDKK